MFFRLRHGRLVPCHYRDMVLAAALALVCDDRAENVLQVALDASRAVSLLRPSLWDAMAALKMSCRCRLTRPVLCLCCGPRSEMRWPR